MAQLDFPSSTSVNVGDQYVATGAGITYTWSGTRWTAMGNITLDDLTGVDILNAQDQDVIIYNGSGQAWLNEPDVNGGAF